MKVPPQLRLPKSINILFPTLTFSFAQAFTFECANHGIIIDWHNDTSGELESACALSHTHTCPRGAAYTECARVTDGHCEDIGKRYDTLTHFKCQPGCTCPAGQYFDFVDGELACVDKAQCPCYMLGSDTVYAPGHEVFTLCTSCACQEGLYTCQDLQCENVRCLNNQVKF